MDKPDLNTMLIQLAENSRWNVPWWHENYGRKTKTLYKWRAVGLQTTRIWDELDEKERAYKEGWCNTPLEAVEIAIKQKDINYHG